MIGSGYFFGFSSLLTGQRQLTDTEEPLFTWRSACFFFTSQGWPALLQEEILSLFEDVQY